MPHGQCHSKIISRDIKQVHLSRFVGQFSHDSAEQQSEVANVVSQNITNVAQLAEVADESTQHIFLGTKGLSQRAEALRDRVSQFKV
ncbi:MAG: hypothetical protein COB30_010210 [Ectothiorhodospiraceae bacterium]|nr:hypothetical protein [Ectothiorhodospiraceae bacterium]